MLPGGRRIQAGQQPQQRALAAARGAHDGGELSARNFQIDALQDVHAMRAGVDGLGKAVCLNHGREHGWRVYRLLWHSDAYRQFVRGFAGTGGCGSAPQSHAGACAGRRADAAPPAQPDRPTSDNRPVIVAFGDSLTAGFGADPGKSYPDFLQQELDRGGFATAS